VFLGLPAAATRASWRSFRIGQCGWALLRWQRNHHPGGHGTGHCRLLANQAALLHLGGLFQRASTVTGFAWLTTSSARALSARRHQHRQTTDHQ
jgi:hypothetical protein